MAEAWRLAPARPGPASADPPQTRGQRLRRIVHRTIIDRTRGRIGVRVLRLPGTGRVLVVAEAADSLRQVPASVMRPGVRARRLTVLVVWWRAPWRGWSGRLGPLRHVVTSRVSSPAKGRGMSIVDVKVASPVPVTELLSAVDGALRPATAAVAVQSVQSAQSALVTPRVLIDATRVNPRGRRADGYRADAPWAALGHTGRAALTALRLDRWRYGVGGSLSPANVSGLRSVGVVDCPALPGRDPLAEASLLVELAMTGVVVHAPRLPTSVADLIAVPLRRVLAEPVPLGGLDREVRSARQRRTAMREHSAGFAGGFPAPGVSAVLATRRPEHLPTILAAIAGQTYPELEIVLCLHGIELPPAVADQLAQCGRAYQVVPVPGDVSFGNALGLATARASGALVTKFDDDDTYGSEHVWDLVLARHYSGAAMVGKGAEFVFLEDAGRTVRRWSGRPEWDDTVVAGGTMLISRGDLEALGGWRPVPRSVDKALVDRLNRAGASIYRTHPLGYLYHRRSQGHTWDPGQDFFLRGVRSQWDGAFLPDPGVRADTGAAPGTVAAGGDVNIELLPAVSS